MRQISTQRVAFNGFDKNTLNTKNKMQWLTGLLSLGGVSTNTAKLTKVSSNDNIHQDEELGFFVAVDTLSAPHEGLPTIGGAVSPSAEVHVLIKDMPRGMIVVEGLAQVDIHRGAWVYQSEKALPVGSYTVIVKATDDHGYKARTEVVWTISSVTKASSEDTTVAKASSEDTTVAKASEANQEIHSEVFAESIPVDDVLPLLGERHMGHSSPAQLTY